MSNDDGDMANVMVKIECWMPASALPLTLAPMQFVHTQIEGNPLPAPFRMVARLGTVDGTDQPIFVNVSESVSSPGETWSGALS